MKDASKGIVECLNCHKPVAVGAEIKTAASAKSFSILCPKCANLFWKLLNPGVK